MYHCNGHPVQLILFDIDGTLLWPKGAGRESTRAAMREVFGSEGSLNDHHFGGKTDWFTLAELLRESGHTADDIGRRMPEYEQVIAHHLGNMIGDFPIAPCPGALDLVRELITRNWLLLGLITGNVSTTAPLKLRAAGFDPAWFAVGAYGSESTNRNDLPFLALERAEQLRGHPIAAQSVIIVGDTPADVACARAVGAVSVAVNTGFSSRESLEATQPDYLLDDLTTFFSQVLSQPARTGR
ncbi:MAG: HAD hydrolase-like protein [Anaerolineaceae bacterium]|nr:HAD hydrolase-like protein [Anaerolineaceae bacterium]